MFDNSSVDRLWRSVKYERLYLYEYETVLAVTASRTTPTISYNYVRQSHRTS